MTPRPLTQLSHDDMADIVCSNVRANAQRGWAARHRRSFPRIKEVSALTTAHRNLRIGNSCSYGVHRSNARAATAQIALYSISFDQGEGRRPPKQHRLLSSHTTLAGRRRLSEWRTPLRRARCTPCLRQSPGNGGSSRRTCATPQPYSVDRISGLRPIAPAMVRVPRRVRSIVPRVDVATVPRV